MKPIVAALLAAGIFAGAAAAQSAAAEDVTAAFKPDAVDEAAARRET